MSAALAQLAAIAWDPNDASVVRAGAPLNWCELRRIHILMMRKNILSASERCELAALTERDRAEDPKRKAR